MSKLFGEGLSILDLEYCNKDCKSGPLFDCIKQDCIFFQKDVGGKLRPHCDTVCEQGPQDTCKDENCVAYPEREILRGDSFRYEGFLSRKAQELNKAYVEICEFKKRGDMESLALKAKWLNNKNEELEQMVRCLSSRIRIEITNKKD